jgi:hypothetical protein
VIGTSEKQKGIGINKFAGNAKIAKDRRKLKAKTL